jgi:hypothetical protein
LSIHPATLAAARLPNRSDHHEEAPRSHTLVTGHRK